ncbi:hypothetical protein B0H16DRAFT_60870 [Mycena metata]|uniref:Uncharacterized protein n=1 Tax=Mycena metata TaxID=1033252 RepID=A0AAD7IEC1_9AGAR|nr:hypothetical protein B0H16DRAFT_60870 [Mycena metata]
MAMWLQGCTYVIWSPTVAFFDSNGARQKLLDASAWWCPSWKCGSQLFLFFPQSLYAILGIILEAYRLPAEISTPARLTSSQVLTCFGINSWNPCERNVYSGTKTRVYYMDRRPAHQRPLTDLCLPSFMSFHSIPPPGDSGYPFQCHSRRSSPRPPPGPPSIHFRRQIN